jgi:hypothetical protein
VSDSQGSDGTESDASPARLHQGRPRITTISRPAPLFDLVTAWMRADKSAI